MINHTDYLLVVLLVHYMALNTNFGNSSVFLKDLNIGLEGTLSKFGGNTKLEGPVESLDGKEALQADLDKLEGLAITNHMKFNRNKCQAGLNIVLAV